MTGGWQVFYPEECKKTWCSALGFPGLHDPSHFGALILKTWLPILVSMTWVWGNTGPGVCGKTGPGSSIRQV